MPKTACKTQCGQCPFRPDSVPGWLGGYTPGDVFQAAWFNQPFYCHTRIPSYEDPNWLERAEANGLICLGFLAFANTIRAPKRVDDRFEAGSQEEILAMRAAIEGRKDLAVMDAQTFLSWHNPKNTVTNGKALLARRREAAAVGGVSP